MAGGKDDKGNVIGNVSTIYCEDGTTQSPTQSPQTSGPTQSPEVDPGTSNDATMLHSIWVLGVMSFAMSFE